MVAQITPLSDPPSRADPENFVERSDQFMSELPVFAIEANALASEVAANKGLAQSAVTDAATQVSLATDQVALAADQVALANTAALAASGAAKYKGDYSAAVLYAVGESVSYAGGTYAKKTTAPAGTTPVNGTDWLKLGAYVGDTLTTPRSLSAPDWLPCNGGVYLQSSYAALFGVLGLLVAEKNAGAWTARTLPSSAGWRSVTYGNGVFVAVASGSTAAATSPDGISWTARTLPSSANWYSVTHGNGVFVAVAGNSTAAATSPDGISWTARTLPSSTNWYSVTYGNGVFVAVAASSTAAANTLNILPYNTATQFITPSNDSPIAGLTTYIKT